MTAIQAPVQFTLNDLRPGQWGQVKAISGFCSQTQRLMAMGLLPGTNVKLESIAPLADPIALRLPGCVVSIRRCDAKRVAMERTEAPAESN